MKTFTTILEKRVGPCYGYDCHPTHSFVHTAEGAKEPDVMGTFWNLANLTEAYERENAGGVFEVTLGDGTCFYRDGVESVEVAQALFGFMLDTFENGLTDGAKATAKAIGFSIC